MSKSIKLSLSDFDKLGLSEAVIDLNFSLDCTSTIVISAWGVDFLKDDFCGIDVLGSMDFDRCYLAGASEFKFAGVSVVETSLTFYDDSFSIVKDLQGKNLTIKNCYGCGDREGKVCFEIETAVLWPKGFVSVAIYASDCEWVFDRESIIDKRKYTKSPHQYGYRWP